MALKPAGKVAWQIIRAGLPGCQYEDTHREANEIALWATKKMADEHTKDIVTFCFTEIIEGPDSLLVTNKGDKKPVAALLSRFDLDCFSPLNSCFFSLCLSSISRLLIHNMLILDDETSLTPFKPEDQHFPDYDTQKGISSNLSANFFTFEAELSLPRNIYRAILIYYYYSSVNLMLFQPRINKPCFYALNNGCLIAPEVQLQVKGIAVEVEFLQIFCSGLLAVDDAPILSQKGLFLPEEKYLCLKRKATHVRR